MNVDLPPFRVLSLFSGVCGLDLGIRLAVPHARTVCYVERDSYCRRVIQARIRDGSLDDAPIWDDVSTLDGVPWRGQVEAIIGGFPCTDISNAGRRAGIEGKQSGLWSHFARLVGEIRPRYVYVENVSALLVRGMDRVLGEISALGYDAEWLSLSAAAVGAPHLRKRVFVLAHAQRAERRQDALPRSDCREGRDGEGEAAGRAGECGCTLAHAQSQRGELRAAEGERPGRPAGGNKPMGDPEREGLEIGRVQPGDMGEEQPAAERAGLPLFPPGPGDTDAWRAILAEHPEAAPATEPGVRAVDDELSHRMAQLKACGNAVLPLQSAVAFTILARRLRCLIYS